MAMTPDLSLLARAVRRLGPQRVFEALDAEQRAALRYVWPIMARPKQLAPRRRARSGRVWRWWLVQSGRGFGKTRSGSEWVRGKAKRMPGSIGALIGQTPDDVRKIQIEGPAGILECSPANERPHWEPAKGELTWPNGTKAFVHSGAEPRGLRGPQFHWAWCDELAKMAKAKETFDNLNMALRLEYSGEILDEHDSRPQGCITTTPRPIAVMRELVKKASCVVTDGSTYENAANLAADYLAEMRESYEGTRLGEQELHGKLIDDVPGALWMRAWFEREWFRTKRRDDLSIFDAIVVAIDPATSDAETSAETGIIVAGMWRDNGRRRYHVLDDRSLYGSANARARAAILAFSDYDADSFVVETNNGGDWIPAVITNEWEAMKREDAFAQLLPGRAPVNVVTASRGKHVRAEPISTLYEQLGTVTHEASGLEVLEDQLVTWSPLLNERSPDRLDALVWALTDLSTRKVVVLT